MNFVTFKRFYSDIASWEKNLPFFDAVCGVPRSGLIPAAYIALRRNIRLVEFHSLVSQTSSCIDTAMIRSNNPLLKKEKGNKILIVDDATSEDGLTLKWIKKQLINSQALDISYGVVYGAKENTEADYVYRVIPQNRIFEWNWLRNRRLAEVLFDCDGVLCHDWISRLEQTNDPGFLAHVQNVRPLFIPQVPILGVVTSRIEKYRAETDKWLRSHGIVFKHLIMHPAKTPHERRMLADHGKRKAKFYSDSNATLFIESDIKQSIEIHQLTGKPVLCTDTMEFFPGD